MMTSVFLRLLVPVPRSSLDGDPEGIAEALAEAARGGGQSWRLLVSRDDDGPYTVATVRQLLSTRDASSSIDLETWDGGQSGASLVAGCSS